MQLVHISLATDNIMKAVKLFSIYFEYVILSF